MGEHEKPKYECIQITNPHYLGVIGPFIKSFLDKVEIPGVTYESLYAFLSNVIQSGHLLAQQGMRDTSEFWIVLEDGKPIAFACWNLCSYPSIGTVYCPFCYSWQTKKIPTRMLGKEFIRFGQEMRAKYYKFDATNERVYEVFKSTLEELGLDVNRTTTVNAYCTRKG